MKKTIILLSIFLLVFLILIIIVNKQDEQLQIVYIDNFDEDYQEKLKVCTMRQDGKLVLIDVLKHNNEQNYYYILKLYDHYRNALPLGYSTPFKGNFEIEKLEKENDYLKGAFLFKIPSYIEEAIKWILE